MDKAAELLKDLRVAFNGVLDKYEPAEAQEAKPAEESAKAEAAKTEPAAPTKTYKENGNILTCDQDGSCYIKKSDDPVYYIKEADKLHKSRDWSACPTCRMDALKEEFGEKWDIRDNGERDGAEVVLKRKSAAAPKEGGQEKPAAKEKSPETENKSKNMLSRF